MGELTGREDYHALIARAQTEHRDVMNDFLKLHSQTILEISKAIVECYRNDGRVLLFGNGGSAADAQHWAGELVNKFRFDRPHLDAEALTTDTSVLTAIGNDSSFDYVFSKQIEAKCNPRDVAVGISTSGNSPNIVNGLAVAYGMDAMTVGMTGEGGCEMKKYSKLLLDVPSHDTPRIQECHEFAYHMISEIVEDVLFGGYRG